MNQLEARLQLCGRKVCNKYDLSIIIPTLPSASNIPSCLSHHWYGVAHQEPTRVADHGGSAHAECKLKHFKINILNK